MEFVNSRSEGTKQKLVLGWRLGLYDPDPASPRMIKYVGRVYGSSPREQRIMRFAIQNYNRLASEDKGSHLCIGAYPVDG